MQIDLDKLDKLPYHERLWEKDGWKDWDHKYWRGGNNFKLLDNYFKGYVNRPINELQIKTKYALFPNYNFDKWLSNQIDFYKVVHKQIYYIDENNILKYEGRLYPKPFKPKYENRESWERYKTIKREYKIKRKIRKKRELFLLSIINNKPIYEYYKIIASSFGLRNNQEEITQFESGNFSSYYKSAGYIRSIGKLYPHFEQP